jgi:D-glycero-beta-D-manno-heptose-7-phosphate kinase
MTISHNRIQTLVGDFRGKRVAVLGDVMLDRYCWGLVKRVSPEAPVPVVEVQSEQTRFGGAANVANNVLALGGVPYLIGLVGDDHPGTQFLEMMEEAGLDNSGIVRDPSRPTTIKTRVIAQNQHVVRIDNESKTPCTSQIRARLMDAVRKEIKNLDAVIIEDYNKGVLSREVIGEVSALARTHQRIVTVDPKFDNFLEYKGVTVFKPNRRETEEVLGGRLRSTEEVEAAGKKLLAQLAARNVLITRGEEGMSLFEATGEVTHIPAQAQNVQDVSGAGDTVISTLTIALAAGSTVREACLLASYGGSVVVGYVGIVPVTPAQLIAEALAHTTDPTKER